MKTQSYRENQLVSTPAPWDETEPVVARVLDATEHGEYRVLIEHPDRGSQHYTLHARVLSPYPGEES